MRFFLLLFLMLPVIELVGFFVIGAKIGLARSVLWLITATTIGVMVIKSAGTQSWTRMRQGENAFVVPDLFDALCRLLAGVLLVFPGFISDFIALLFLTPVLRHAIFRLTGTTTSVNQNEAAPPASGNGTIIDGEYRHLDQD